MSVSVSVKLVDGTEHAVSVPDLTITVRQFKVECEKVISFPPAEQRAVFRGKILKDDDTLQSYGVLEGSAIHIVRSKKSEPKPATVPEASQTSQTATPPAQTSQTSQPNPYSILSSGYGSNPQAGTAGLGAMGGMGIGVPQMQNLLQNPNAMEAMSAMMRDPQTIAALSRMDPMLGQMSPEAIQRISQLMTENPELMQLTMNQAMAGMGGMGGMAGMGGMGGMGGVGSMGIGATGATQPPTAPGAGISPSLYQQNLPVGANMWQTFAPPPVQGNPREVYRQQLEEMREMGFPSEEANLAALQQTQGNVSFAVDRLLNAP